MHHGTPHGRYARWGATSGGCGSGHGSERYGAWYPAHEWFSGGFEGAGFGVRRPLRYLAYKLRLEETQVAELARILNELKTERAQAAVDERRTITAFADSVAAETFDEGKAAEAATFRVQSAQRLQDAVVRAIARIHSILDPEQRSRLAYLIRTGALTL